MSEDLAAVPGTIVFTILSFYLFVVVVLCTCLVSV